MWSVAETLHGHRKNGSGTTKSWSRASTAASSDWAHQREELMHASSLDDWVLSKSDIEDTLCKVVAEIGYSVTFADPDDIDYPFKMISPEFEALTGYKKAEVLGHNCRFIGEGCDNMPNDVMNIRVTCKSGVPTTVVLTNRKKSGELFRNLFYLGGLTVAQHVDTGADLWYLIGIQKDVTDIEELDVDEHILCMECVAEEVRSAIAGVLAEVAQCWKHPKGDFECKVEEDHTKTWCVLSSPRWRADDQCSWNVEGTATDLAKAEEDPALPESMKAIHSVQTFHSS